MLFWTCSEMDATNMFQLFVAFRSYLLVISWRFLQGFDPVSCAHFAVECATSFTRHGAYGA